ncbi:helix-turn-helix domain-containing protein [Pseudonocardia sp. DLS-67]
MPERPAEVEWVVRRPDPGLCALIARYIGYRQHGVTLDVHRGLPSRHVTVIVSFEEPVRLLEGPGSGRGPASFQAFVGGLHADRVLIAQDRVQAGVHLELNPLGVRTLLGVSASELTGRVVDLGDLGRPGFATLPDRLRAAPDWAARFRVLDEVLLASATRVSVRLPLEEIGWAWQRLVRTGGGLPVAELAAEVGWSRRHFSERFSQEVGLSPKRAARVVRFGRAAELLRRLPLGGLTDVAQRCGYVDQAHLTNEWRSMAGCTPRTWLVEEFPFLQDTEVMGGST